MKFKWIAGVLTVVISITILLLYLNPDFIRISGGSSTSRVSLLLWGEFITPPTPTKKPTPPPAPRESVQKQRWIAFRDAFYNDNKYKFCDKNNICEYDAYIYMNWNTIESHLGSVDLTQIDNLLNTIAQQKVRLPDGKTRPRKAWFGLRIYSSPGNSQVPDKLEAIRFPQELKNSIAKCKDTNLYTPIWSSKNLGTAINSTLKKIIDHLDKKNTVAGYIVTTGWDEELTPSKVTFICVNSVSGGIDPITKKPINGFDLYYNVFLKEYVKRAFKEATKPVLWPIGATKGKYAKVIEGWTEEKKNWALTSHAIYMDGSPTAYIWANGQTSNVDYGGGWMQVIKKNFKHNKFPGFEYGNSVPRLPGKVEQKRVYWTLLYALSVRPQVMDYQEQFLKSLNDIKISPMKNTTLKLFTYNIMNDPYIEKYAFIIFRGCGHTTGPNGPLPCSGNDIKRNWGTDHPWHYESGIKRIDLTFDNYNVWKEKWKKEIFCYEKNESCLANNRIFTSSDPRLWQTVSPNGINLGEIKLKSNRNLRGEFQIQYSGGPFKVKVGNKVVKTCSKVDKNKIRMCTGRLNANTTEFSLSEERNTYFHSLVVIYK